MPLGGRESELHRSSKAEDDHFLFGRQDFEGVFGGQLSHEKNPVDIPLY